MKPDLYERAKAVTEAHTAALAAHDTLSRAGLRYHLYAEAPVMLEKARALVATLEELNAAIDAARPA